MSHRRWSLLFGLGLIALSAGFYGIHYALFHDPHHIWIYLVGDVAFVPLEVLLVTLILHQLLESRERKAKLQKLNMAIGVFFAEMGTELLARLRRVERVADPEALGLAINGTWKPQDFAAAQRRISALKELSFSTAPTHLAALKDFLLAKRPFILTLLENPNLLEHESFTDLLWAVFHLTDELGHRQALADLPATDQKHLDLDTARAFTNLLRAWINHMQHLQSDYPYLFSLAVRTNPFDPSATVVIGSA